MKFKFGSLVMIHQFAKFSFLPKFVVIRYLYQVVNYQQHQIIGRHMYTKWYSGNFELLQQFHLVRFFLQAKVSISKN